MAQNVCNVCNGAGVVEFDIPFTHNAGRDVGYIETATDMCDDCSGYGYVTKVRDFVSTARLKKYWDKEEGDSRRRELKRILHYDSPIYYTTRECDALYEAVIASNIKIYRICIRKHDETVGVKCLDILAVDSELEHEYKNVHELPSWVQSKIAVLMTIQDALLPVEVEGVGRRISDVTYWIYSDES